jgi:hypothetical protein
VYGESRHFVVECFVSCSKVLLCSRRLDSEDSDESVEYTDDTIRYERSAGVPAVPSKRLGENGHCVDDVAESFAEPRASGRRFR